MGVLSGSDIDRIKADALAGVNSDLGTPLDTTIGKKGDVAATTDSSSLFAWVKSIFAKTNTMDGKITTINSNTARGAVRSVQRGIVAIDSNGTASMTISLINPAKSVVLINGGYFTVSGGQMSTSGRGTFMKLSALTSTQLVVSGESCSGSWQIIEFY